MKKKLIIINGTMGVGKTTVCKELYARLENLIWLDGDWCWMMHPWKITDENKKMVMENIRFLLRSYLSNSSFEYIVFSWVIHRQEILDQLLAGLAGLEFELFKITLTCSELKLIHRLKEDKRSEGQISESVGRLHHYDQMDTMKIDTTCTTVAETADRIVKSVSLTDA